MRPSKNLLKLCQKAAQNELKEKNTQVKVYIRPMLDLKNCVATSMVLTTAMYVKPGLKEAKNAGKIYFPNRFALKK